MLDVIIFKDHNIHVHIKIINIYTYLYDRLHITVPVS